MAFRFWAKLKLIRASALVVTPADRWPRSAKMARARRVYIVSRAPWPLAWPKWPAPPAAPRFRSIETLRFFTFAGIFQRFDLGKQTIAAQAPFFASGHWDVRQFRAPTPSLLLAGHRGTALCAAFFHGAMMAQLRRAVQRCEF